MHIIHKTLCFFENSQPTQKEIGLALLVARIAVGIFFITHGFSKLSGIDGFVGMLDGLGWPMAALFAWLVAIAEFFGGFAILLGVFTRFSAFWLSIITLYAWIAVKSFSLGMGPGEGDVDLLALGLTVAIFFAGPGELSVSAHMKKGDQQM
jgi:putative oxidoreductase